MATLLDQWRALPAGDRKGILRRIAAPQRMAFERLLNTGERERAEAEARSRRFHAYSPWLADLLDACEKGEAAASGLSPQVRGALLAGHESAIHAKSNAQLKPTLIELARSQWRKWRELL
ncbi:MAG TPA: hypothetical protein VL094_07100 [Sphingomonadaceae bacterium]|nr:hypothetical protein [Sphingomonadaceae bacterium]